MSINLSALQIAQSTFGDDVQRILEQTGVPPEKIHLEMTETAFSNDEIATTAGIVELHRLGTQLSIDDFGVGYSSLNYLRKFPADFLKIDKSFVDEIGDPRTFRVVMAAIDVGHALGMKAVAEGVETLDQLRLLMRIGCNYAQGYLFHQPMPSQQAMQTLMDEMYQAGGDTPPMEQLTRRVAA